jgi:hypothetical protein
VTLDFSSDEILAHTRSSCAVFSKGGYFAKASKAGDFLLITG